MEECFRQPVSQRKLLQICHCALSQLNLPVEAKCYSSQVCVYRTHCSVLWFPCDGTLFGGRMQIQVVLSQVSGEAGDQASR